MRYGEHPKIRIEIKYNFEFQGNTLILDNYLVTDIENKYRNQKIEIYLYLPEGTLFQCDESVKSYDMTDNGFFDLWFDSDDHMYMMEKDSVKCLDCVVEDEIDAEGELDIPAPPHPGHPTHINATGRGAVHISDEDMDMHVSVDSISIRTRGTN